MRVQILGSGCPKCKLLAERTSEAARGVGLEIEVVKVTDITEILGYGVMSTPALAIDGQVKLSGKVPTVAELHQLLTTHA
ncbi:MAG: thioredoxin family protein [bacterium]|nr:thioredoxin family protein [bacterium]